MKTRAALIWSQPGKFEVSTVDLDEPKSNEVLVRMVAAGLCHSDDHFVTGDIPCAHLPRVGGHEGAGVVEAVGSAVRTLRAGDHVVMAFIPSCGRCRWCSSGMQNLCDNGALMPLGTQLDGTYRMHIDGKDISQAACTGTFSEYTVVSEWGCVKIDPEVPLEEACILGCAVPTGWGSAEAAAGVRAGDTHIVMGIGGIGIHAVQAARHVGASHVIAVDPVPFKRETAEQFGATASFETMAAAGDYARSLTNGQGADSAVVSVGVVVGEDVRQAFTALRKGGTVVVTAASKMTEVGLPVSLVELTMFQKRIQGALFGTLSPARDIPRLAALYRAGQLKLKEAITRTYTLDQVNEGFADMHAGRNIRGIIRFDA